MADSKDPPPYAPVALKPLESLHANWSGPAVPKAMELTVVKEGEAAVPSSMEWTERTSQGSGDVGVVATIRGKGRYHQTLKLIAVGMIIAYVLFIAIVLFAQGTVSLDPGSLFCGFIIGLFPLILPASLVANAIRKGQMVLGPYALEYREKGLIRSRSVAINVADIHGFGYQRSADNRFAWEVAAILRSGMTVSVPIPTVRKEDARWVARRLNAALAEVQKKGPT